MPLPFPGDPRTAVTESPESQLVVSDILALVAFDPLATPTSNDEKFLIDTAGPHGLFDIDADTLGNPDGTFAGNWVPSIGHYLYVFGACALAGGFIAIDFGVNVGGGGAGWWQCYVFALMPGVPLPIPGVEITTPYARVRFGNTSAGLIFPQVSVITRTR